MKILSKSKIMAYRQCPRRLWLEINHPEYLINSVKTEKSFSVGFAVGEIAKRIYDPKGVGQEVQRDSGNLEQAFTQTKALLAESKPIFEAGFKAGGAMAFADVMLPVAGGHWRMVEVKSATELKDYYKDDAAIQWLLAKIEGVPVDSIAIAHINSAWVYREHGNYQGLLMECEVTQPAKEREEQVISWIAEGQKILTAENEPVCDVGKQCFSPYECGFYHHCTAHLPTPEISANILPRKSKAINEYLETLPVPELCEVPDDLLNDIQLRVKHCTLTNTPYFDAKSAQSELAKFQFPLLFMDFETIQFAVPIWLGTRPYQQIPFQFSVHILDKDKNLFHHEFLGLSGDDPSEAFARQLIKVCGKQGAIVTYNAGFEKSRVKDLGERFPALQNDLLAINARVVDLLPIARKYYYHPSQQGSWSIKSVLPAAVPTLSYSALDGVKEGAMAMEAFIEAISPQTTIERKQELERQLLAYCQLDTLAMVRIWQAFSQE